MSPPPHQSRPPRKETARHWWWSPSRTRPRKGGGRGALRIPLSRIGRRWEEGWNIGGKWRVGRARDLAHGTDSTETRHRRCRLIHPLFPPQKKKERREGTAAIVLCAIFCNFSCCVGRGRETGRTPATNGGGHYGNFQMAALGGEKGRAPKCRSDFGEPRMGCNRSERESGKFFFLSF